ncbi:hypothetical protein X975_13409, partial [Stegodyphus mimosarum]
MHPYLKIICIDLSMLVSVGASSMSGCYGGLQAVIQSKSPNALGN